MNNSSRIALNTGILYIKLFLTIIIALFSTRLILNALGVIDFGIYSLIGGVIGALTFVNKAMGGATQRFLSYSRGKGIEAVAQVFNTSLVIHICIGFGFVIVLELLGLFLFKGFLNIPAERVSVAKFVFHCMVATSFFSVIAVPYDAIMNAKENMFIFSLFGFLESLGKLGIAFYLYYSPLDTLATYALGMALMTILLRTIKRIYSHHKYIETRIHIKKVDVKLMKEMFGFCVWSTVDILSHVAKGDGIPILLNNFFSPLVNAAYGVSSQVRHNVAYFSEMIFKSSNPQIMQNIGAGNISKSIKISEAVCKFSFVLFALFTIPLVIEMPVVLSLWLKKVPDGSVIFCRLVLLTNLMIMLARNLQFLIDGVGKIREYRIWISFCNVLVFPIAYLMLKLGFSAPWVFVGIFLSDFLVILCRLYFAKKLVHVNIARFILAAPLRLALLSGLVFFITYFIKQFLSLTPFIELCAITFCSSVLLVVGFYAGVLNEYEKSKVRELFLKIRNKIYVRGVS